MPPRTIARHLIEVGFVFEDLAVDVKARKNVLGRDLKELRALREEGLFAQSGSRSAMLPCRAKSWTHCSTATTAWCCSRASGSRWTATGCARPSSTGMCWNGRPKAVSRIAHVVSGGLLPSQCSLARVARTLSPNAIKVEPNRACGGRPATATEVTQDSGGRPPRPGRSSTRSPSGVADFRVVRIKSVPAGANVLVHACVDLSGLHQRPHRLDQTLTRD